MRRPSWLAIPLFSLLVVACSADAPGGPGGSSNTRPIALEDACEAFRSSMCAVYVGCGFVTAENATYCEQAFLDCGEFALDRYVADGSLVYDGAALRRCLATLETSPCEEDGWIEVFMTDADCRAAYRGVVAVGGECEDGIECESGACDQGECPARCLATGAAGAACGPGLAPCAPHLGCVDGSCSELPGAGERCTQDYYYGDDYAYGRCGPGLVCDDSDLCRAYGAEGDPCLNDDEEYAGAEVPCAMNLRCDAGRCAALGEVGAPCDWSEDCRSALRCTSGHCAPRVGAGEPCARTEDDGEGCALGLDCLSSGVCGMPLPAGAACDEYTDDCRDWCEGTICVEEVGPGQACDDVSRYCWSGPCVDGVCTEDCSGW